MDQKDQKPESFPLNTKDASAKIWLVRVPKIVSQKWEKNIDQPLGQISVQNNKVQVILKEQIYDLQTQKSIPLYAISKSSKEFKIHGTIENIYNMRPLNTKIFGKSFKNF